MTFNWQRGPGGRVRGIEQQTSPTESVSPPAAISSNVATSGTTAFAGFGKEQVNLPPAPVVWGFRLQTAAFADKLVKGLAPQNQKVPNRFIECLGRIIRGALMHKDVYRTVASNGSLTTEAMCVALALIVISTVGLNVAGLFGVWGELLRQSHDRSGGRLGRSGSRTPLRRQNNGSR